MFQTVLAVAIAVLMHRLTQSTVIRGLILLPFLISNVIAALVWFWLLDYQIGLVNGFIAAIGFDKIPFFGDAALGDSDHCHGQCLAAYGLHTLCWSSPGCRRYPTTVYEAASVDGSTEWQSFWRITLPLLADPGAGAW